MNQGLNIKPEIIKFLDENIGGKLLDISLRGFFLGGVNGWQQLNY